jgi:hypothetical protein
MPFTSDHPSQQNRTWTNFKQNTPHFEENKTWSFEYKGITLSLKKGHLEQQATDIIVSPSD